MLLIVTNANDKHADFVETRLRERGVAYHRFNTETFPQHTAICLGFNNGVVTSHLVTRDSEIDLRKTTHVWYRKPAPPIIDHVITDPVARNFSEQEARTSLENLWETIPGLWINNIFAMRRANNRFLQWQMAQELGFRMPATMLTNSPAMARNFIDHVGGKVALKVIGQTLVAGEDAVHAMYTRLCDDAVLAEMDTVRFTPSILQTYIEKRVEHRVTVIGDRVFDCIIESQATTKTQIDWRRYDLAHTPHRIGTLSDSIAQQCLEITHRLGLLFSGIDLIETPDGDFVFLEINCSPQWGWIEAVTGMPLRETLIDLLT